MLVLLMNFHISITQNVIFIPKKRRIFKIDLNKHIIKVHEKTKLSQCSGCDFRSPLKMQMSRHLQTIHKNQNCEILYLGDKDQKCTLCDYRSALKVDLTKHIHEFRDVKQNWSCTVCDIVFKRKKTSESTC